LVHPISRAKHDFGAIGSPIAVNNVSTDAIAQ
jgi:hypothetical protein